jgi:hypothetical protein
MKICINPGCRKKAATRGLCKGHYSNAWRLVNGGMETWENLEKHGMILPKKKPHGYEELKDAIIAILKKDEYPGGKRIKFEMSGKWHHLSGRERSIRNKIFKELGINFKTKGKEFVYI